MRDDGPGLQCSAEWRTQQLPLEDRVRAAIQENPANRGTTPSTPEDDVVEALLGGLRLSDNHRRHLPTAALLTANKWMGGRHLQIAFLEGSDIQKAKVKKWAQGWGFVSVRFDFIDDPNAADIRIGFDSTDGSWSFLGTDAAASPAPAKTMNFGWVNDTSTDASDQRVILHEFGHVLGFIHEHQNPAANIQWNKPAVYAWFGGPPNNWSTGEVDSNIFYQYPASAVGHSGFDVSSIMIYPIEAAWTTNGFSAPATSTLSGTDVSQGIQWYRMEPIRGISNVAIGQDAAGTFMISYGGTLDRRRRHGLLWQPFELDFLNLGALSAYIPDLLLVNNGQNHLFFTNLYPVHMSEANGTDNWTPLDYPAVKKVFTKLAPYVDGGTVQFLGLEYNGPLGQGILEPSGWQYNEWVNGAPTASDVAVVVTASVLEVMIVSAAGGSTIGLQIGDGITPTWTPVPFAGQAASLWSIPEAPGGQFAMFDTSGALWVCDLNQPPTSRTWVNIKPPGSASGCSVSSATDGTRILLVERDSSGINVARYQPTLKTWDAWTSLPRPGSYTDGAPVFFADGVFTILGLESSPDNTTTYQWTSTDGVTWTGPAII